MTAAISRPTEIRVEPPPPWIEAAPGVRMRPLVEGGGMSLILYQIDPGTQFEPHRHAFGELGVVLQGTGQMTVGDSTRELKAGESYSLPPDVLHGLSVAEGKEPMVLIDIAAFAPSDLPAPPISEMKDLTAKVVRKGRAARRH